MGALPIHQITAYSTTPIVLMDTSKVQNRPFYFKFHVSSFSEINFYFTFHVLAFKFQILSFNFQVLSFTLHGIAPLMKTKTKMPWILFTVDLRCLEYHRLAFSFHRERMGRSPPITPIATVQPFLSRTSSQQRDETLRYPALHRWRPHHASTGEQWRAAPILTLPSGVNETHLDVGTNVRPANRPIIANYIVCSAYICVTNNYRYVLQYTAAVRTYLSYLVLTWIVIVERLGLFYH